MKIAYDVRTLPMQLRQGIRKWKVEGQTTGANAKSVTTSFMSPFAE